jgi:ribosomal protein S18 acetylase RimI-like enzyme
VLSILIREAAVEDSAALAKVQVDSYRASYAGLLPQSFLDGFSYDAQTGDWRELLSGESPDIVLVGETDDGEIVGYALSRKLQGDTDQAELVALHVQRSHHRQGIGRKLMRESARRLQEQGAQSLMLWVLAENPARQFYERLGGKLAGEQTITPADGVTAQEVRYRWTHIKKLIEKSDE